MSNIIQMPTAARAAAVAAKVNAFRLFEAEHSSLTHALDHTFKTIGSCAGPKIVIVTGPSGVGKTTLARRLYRNIRNLYAAQIEKEKDFVPVLGVRAIAPHGNVFGWKDFYFRLLTQAHEPLIDRKLLIGREHPLFPDLPDPAPADRQVVDVLRRSFEQCVRKRRTRVLIIDEAHHILLAKDRARLEFQFEALKSLAIETEATIVLVGTYRLLDIRDQSGQLVRRSEIVHFPSYDGEDEAQVNAFVALLRAFQGAMELRRTPDLAPEGRFFFLKSVGCAGVLKDWLLKTYEAALLEREPTIDRSFAERFACPNKSLSTMFREARAGEEKLRDIDLSELERDMLPNIEPEATAANAVAAATAPKKTQRKKGRRVGERNPVRDPVGGRQAA